VATVHFPRQAQTQIVTDVPRCSLFLPPAVSIQYRMAAVKGWFRRTFPATCAVGRFLAGRRMRRIELALAVCFVILVAAIQIRGWLFERQVRSIIEIFQQIQLEKTPAEVAFRFREQYRPYLQEPLPNRPEPCSVQHCRFTLKLEEYGSAMYLLIHYPWTRFPLNMVFRLLGPLGLRYNTLQASVQVDDGLITGLNVDFWVVHAVHGYLYAYVTMGEVHTVRNLGFASRMYPDYADHPNYMVQKPGGCSYCTAYFVDLTPEASREEWGRALDFDYSCIRKFGAGCKSPEQLMPAVARQIEFESTHPAKPVADMEHCDLAAIRLMARDAETVAIVKVLAVGPPTQTWQYVSYLPAKVLKASPYPPHWGQVGYLVDRPTHQRDPRTGQLSADLFRIGATRIALFLPFDDSQVQTNCAVVPATEKYLEAARDGVVADRPHLPRE